jgi:hypothetical protein
VRSGNEVASRRTARPALFLAASLTLFAVACGDSAQSRAATAAGVPHWVPIYPGAKVSAVETRKAGIETYTRFRLDSPADCKKVVTWYHEQMRLAGFNVGNPTSPLPDYCTAGVGGDGPGHTRGLRVRGGGATGGPSSFEVQAVVRELPGAVSRVSEQSRAGSRSTPGRNPPTSWRGSPAGSAPRTSTSRRRTTRGR